MSNFTQQLQKMKTDPGFIAALDQSGGSTPGALKSYGIKENAWSNDDEMFAIVHQMRTRTITSPPATRRPFSHGYSRSRVSHAISQSRMWFSGNHKRTRSRHSDVLGGLSNARSWWLGTAGSRAWIYLECF